MDNFENSFIYAIYNPNMAQKSTRDMFEAFLKTRVILNRSGLYEINGAVVQQKNKDEWQITYGIQTIKSKILILTN